MPTQEEIARGKSKNGRRGSTDNKRRLNRLGGRVALAGTVSWGNALPERVHNIITAVEGIGGAVTFGLSRDGGAYMLTVLLDGDKETLWINGGTDLDEELATIEQQLLDMNDT
jgi:hypothetical protein